MFTGRVNKQARGSGDLHMTLIRQGNTQEIMTQETKQQQDNQTNASQCEKTTMSFYIN